MILDSVVVGHKAFTRDLNALSDLLVFDIRLLVGNVFDSALSLDGGGDRLGNNWLGNHRLSHNWLGHDGLSNDWLSNDRLSVEGLRVAEGRGGDRCIGGSVGRLSVGRLSVGGLRVAGLSVSGWSVLGLICLLGLGLLAGREVAHEIILFWGLKRYELSL